MLVKHASQHVLHMKKALMQVNLQLHHVITDITGSTGLRVLDAILADNHEPHEFDQLRDSFCTNDELTIVLALPGNWRDEHLFATLQCVRQRSNMI